MLVVKQKWVTFLARGGVRAPTWGHYEEEINKIKRNSFLHREVRALNGASHHKTEPYMIEHQSESCIKMHLTLEVRHTALTCPHMS